MTGEPFYDDFADGDAGNFATYAVDGEAECGKYHLLVEVAEERYVYHTAEVVTYSPPLDEGAAEHEHGGEDAGEADAELVEDDAAYEKEEKEHVEVAVGAGEESVFVGRPTEA